MIVERLELLNFRNYSAQEVEFAPHTNVLLGINAQGKSNLLEAVYVLSHLRSHRAGRMRDLVKEGQESASVKGRFADGEQGFGLRLSFGPRGRKVEMNGQDQGSGARVRGLVKCVIFSPDDLYLVKGEPAQRRVYLDETAEGLGPIPADSLRRYGQVLRQRNALLRGWEEVGESFEKAVAPWDEALARAAAPVLELRKKVLEKVQAAARETYRELSGGGKELELSYRATFDARGLVEEEITSGMLEELGRRRGEDRRARATTVGPHRDDVEITLGGYDARVSASQGEQRSVAFCLRVAQQEFLRQETGKQPILLLDDVLSELDEPRRRMVIAVVARGGQAVISTAEDLTGILGGAEKVFEVSEGELRVV